MQTQYTNNPSIMSRPGPAEQFAGRLLKKTDVETTGSIGDVITLGRNQKFNYTRDELVAMAKKHRNYGREPFGVLINVGSDEQPTIVTLRDGNQVRIGRTGGGTIALPLENSTRYGYSYVFSLNQ